MDSVAIDKCLSPFGTECGLYDILFFILRKRNMKDIGLKLKEKREENGVSIEEAAEDLKMRPSQIESLEEGRREDFKDVVTLKYFIRDYAKYLGLDGEKMIDEFNEFLFDATSKIPVNDIEKAKENKKKKKEVVSPYTNMSQKKNNMRILVLSIVMVLVLMVVGYLVVSEIHKNNFKTDEAYVVRR